MVHYCCVYECKNSSDEKFSFHGFPSKKSTIKVWVTRIKRDVRKDFKVTKYTKVCSAHFLDEDYIDNESKTRRLKKGAIPSVFSWTKKSQTSTAERSLPEKRRKIEEHNALMEAELTETASEGEGPYETSENPSLLSTSSQTSIELPCNHKFSLNVLRELADTKEKEAKYMKHYTGFSSFEKFRAVLNFVVPDGNRRNIIYWKSRAGKGKAIDTSILFDSDRESQSESDPENELDSSSGRNHLLLVEDEFFLTMMKLRLGLTNLDLAIRFKISEATVTNILITWINFLYVRLGTLKVWPHRRVILHEMPKTFKEDHPNTIIIIGCTELKIQCPSSLVVQSQSYSNYKSTNTLKSLVGVDSKGGFMFVSQLYTGAISDKQIVTRCGFLDLLARKKDEKEINDDDSIMADKGFDIEDDLQKIGLCLNIPPFLQEKPQFDEREVIRTQTVAKHRIHVEQAIGKVRRFLIFNSKLPISSMGTINQIWTVCCLMSNFMDPILADEDDQ